MRLIDANILRMYLADVQLSNAPDERDSEEVQRAMKSNYDFLEFLIKMLDKQPTVYDVDKVVEEYNNRWIPVSTEQFPDTDRYILLSFGNYSVCAIGRYEDGAFYVGDEDTSLSSIGVFVNAWMELPKCYEESEE